MIPEMTSDMTRGWRMVRSTRESSCVVSTICCRLSNVSLTPKTQRKEN